MSRISGPDPRDVAARARQFAAVVNSAVWHTLNAVTRQFSGVITLDDLSGISTEWQTYVTALRDHVGQTFIDAAIAQRTMQRDVLVTTLEKSSPDALVAAATGDEFEIPLVVNAAAEQLMANATNRLSNVGNEIWEVARAQLLTGLQNGEGIPALRNRVMTAANFSSSRAELVARTEIANAMNAGSLAQMRQVDAPGMTKEWIAVHDGRTRPEHAALDGKKIGINQTFAGGLEPGAEPNCRCTYGFDVPDEELTATCGCAETVAEPTQAIASTATTNYTAATPGGEQWVTDNAKHLYAVTVDYSPRPGTWKGQDYTLTEITNHQFPRKPAIGTREDVDAAISNGWTEMWRGVHRKEGMDTFRHQEYFEIGQGIYGNGTYFSESEETARYFAKRMGVGKRDPAVARGAIHPNARIVDYDDLLTEVKQWFDDHGERRHSPETDIGVLFTAVSNYATAQGYDIVRVVNRDDGTRKKRTYATQYIVLNRSAVLVEADNR